MGLKFSNFGKAAIASAPAGTNGLSFTVTPGTGVRFPSLGAGDYFYGIFKDASGNREIVKIEARSADSLTIAAGGRGLDGTTPRTWAAGDYFVAGVPNIALQELFNPSLVALGTLTPAADRLPYFTGDGTASVAALSALMRGVLAAQNEADARWLLKAVGFEGNENIGGNKTFQGENNHMGINTFHEVVSLLAASYAQTPPQFDNSTKIATTAFVQQAGLHFPIAGGIGIAGNRTMAVAEAGRWAEIGAPGVTVTLPPISSTVAGTAYTFKAVYAFTLKASGAELVLSGITGANSLNVAQRQTLTVVSNGPGQHWYVVMEGFGGKAFGSSLAVNGFQQLPSGRLEQWGTLPVNGDFAYARQVTVWFPTAFNEIYHVEGTIYSTDLGGGYMYLTNRSMDTTNATFVVRETEGVVQVGWGIRWRAIGK